MDSQNVALVRRVYELFNSLDPDPEVRRQSPELRELMELFADDVEFVQVGQPDAGSFGDRRSLARTWAEWLNVWREHRSDLVETREKGDRVLAMSSERFVGRDGMVLENRGAGIFTIRDGRIVRFDGYTQQEPAIDAFERS